MSSVSAQDDWTGKKTGYIDLENAILVRKLEDDHQTLVLASLSYGIRIANPIWLDGSEVLSSGAQTLTLPHAKIISENIDQIFKTFLVGNPEEQLITHLGGEKGFFTQIVTSKGIAKIIRLRNPKVVTSLRFAGGLDDPSRQHVIDGTLFIASKLEVVIKDIMMLINFFEALGDCFYAGSGKKAYFAPGLCILRKQYASLSSTQLKTTISRWYFNGKCLT